MYRFNRFNVRCGCTALAHFLKIDYVQPFWLVAVKLINEWGKLWNQLNLLKKVNIDGVRDQNNIFGSR